MRSPSVYDRAASGPSGWIVPTFSSGWASWYSDNRKVQYRREGDLVRVQGLLRRTGATLTTGESTVFVFDDDHVPAAGKFFGVLSNGGGGTTAEFRVYNSGGNGELRWNAGGADAITLAYFCIDVIVFPITATT